MDQTTIETICVPRARADIPRTRTGDAFLAGGSWLFSESQVHLDRLIDLTTLDWAPLVVSDEGLSIAATCTIADLDRAVLPATWKAAPLIGQCCRALLGSFKVWQVATVGGNLCMALPAGPLIALTAALDGTCAIWSADGGERQVPVRDFVLDVQTNALQTGEILRSVDLPAAGLHRRTAFRRISLSPAGRSGALVIGTLDETNTLTLTVTAATRRPIQLAVPRDCDAASLRDAITQKIAPDDWYDDVHGAPDWRAHVTMLLAEEIRAELLSGADA